MNIKNLTKDNFFNYFKSKTFSVMQVVLIILSTIATFGVIMLLVMIEQSKDYGGLFISYKDNMTPVLIMIGLSIIFGIAFILGIIFTILKNIRRKKAYNWFKLHRDEIETEDNIKNNYNDYKSMVKSYVTIYGLFKSKKNGKATSFYNILTILYGLMIIIDVVIIAYLDFAYVIQNGINSIPELALLYIPFVLLPIYLDIFIERLIKQKTYYVKDSVWFKDNQIEGNFDEKFLDFASNDKSLHSYINRIGNKRSWFTYIFSFVSSAILVGLPMIVILAVIFLLLWIINMILSMFNLNTSGGYSSSSSYESNTSSDNSYQNVHGYEGQGRVMIQDVSYGFINSSGDTLKDSRTGIEYRIYNYNRTTGYFEDENGNVYYVSKRTVYDSSLGNEIIYSNDYRHYGESQIEADNRISKML